MNYVAPGKAKPVCKPGDFIFGFSGLDHGHAYGMTTALVQSGGRVAAVWDPDPGKVAAYREQFPQARAARSLEELLDDPSLSMIACAAVPSMRVDCGLAAQRAGKHFFSDKPGFVSREAVERARLSTRETGKLWAVYYSERLHNEASVRAGELIRQGAIGRVVNVVGFGPHRLAAATRPDWLFDPARAGGILTDLASHQIEQFLSFTGSTDARILQSRVRNVKEPGHPGFWDFGELMLLGSGGASGYFRVDWLTPDGLGTWGDGRVTILGTEGYIELRKYIDIGRDPQGDHVYLVDHSAEKHERVTGEIGFPFFGDLILDCLRGTRTAMDQDYIFRVAQLAIQAQEMAMSTAAES